MVRKDDNDHVSPAGASPERSRCEMCGKQFISAATGYWSWRLCNEYGIGVCLCVGCASWVESVSVDVALLHLRVTIPATRPAIGASVIDKILEVHTRAVVESLSQGVARMIAAGNGTDRGSEQLANEILQAIGDGARAELAERVAWAIIDDDAWRDRVMDALKVRLERLRKACGIA